MHHFLRRGSFPRQRDQLPPESVFWIVACPDLHRSDGGVAVAGQAEVRFCLVVKASSGGSARMCVTACTCGISLGMKSLSLLGELQSSSVVQYCYDWRRLQRNSYCLQMLLLLLIMWNNGAQCCKKANGREKTMIEIEPPIHAIKCLS